MIAGAGVDTWSICWYLPERSASVKAMEELATEPAARSRMMPTVIEGHRVGWFPAARMLFAEGHPAEGGLCPSDALPTAQARITDALHDFGILPPPHKLLPLTKMVGLNEVGLRSIGGTGFGGIRRLDSTVNIEFDRPAEGLAVLAGVAAVPVPRSKTQIIREVGGRRVETVYFRGTSGKRVLGRWYDKGVESGAAARGLFVRPEDQRRFPKEARLDVEAVAESNYARDAFVRRFEPLWRASKGVKVAGAIELAERIRELVEEGAMSPSEAKSAAGYLLLETAQANCQSRATRYRDRRRCADHGLVLADGVLDEVELDLGEVIERALDSDCWGAQG
ncbi:MAG TPA: hypothetical protein VHQ43_07130 [Solirubrobacterales bacterium]|nr:hypothetical protein [Solirubrobacterales bacterium]